MNRKEFLYKTSIAGAGFVLLPGLHTFAKKEKDTEPFQLPELNYSYGSLMPFIDEKTMRIHYSKHFQGYTNNLNQAIKGTAYEQSTIEEIIKSIDEKNSFLRNNAGGYYNHLIYFTSLSPKAQQHPKGKLKARIKQQFGTTKDCIEQLNQAASSVFGSGWAWLVVDDDQNLSIVTTPNQDNPSMPFVQLGTPLLGIDVWEHAYYLKYQNKRQEYLTAFWKVLDWETIEQRFDEISN